MENPVDRVRSQIFLGDNAIHINLDNRFPRSFTEPGGKSRKRSLPGEMNTKSDE
jgi:hypothetical protein